MNVFDLLLVIFGLVMILAILNKLAVRRAKQLVEMELQSSAANPFADILLGTQPTQESSEPEKWSPREAPSTFSKDYVPNSALRLKPTLRATPHKRAPLP